MKEIATMKETVSENFTFLQNAIASLNSARISQDQYKKTLEDLYTYFGTPFNSVFFRKMIYRCLENLQFRENCFTAFQHLFPSEKDMIPLLPFFLRLIYANGAMVPRDLIRQLSEKFNICNEDGEIEERNFQTFINAFSDASITAFPELDHAAGIDFDAEDLKRELLVFLRDTSSGGGGAAAPDHPAKFFIKFPGIPHFFEERMLPDSSRYMLMPPPGYVSMDEENIASINAAFEETISLLEEQDKAEEVKNIIAANFVKKAITPFIQKSTDRVKDFLRQKMILLIEKIKSLSVDDKSAMEKLIRHYEELIKQINESLCSDILIDPDVQIETCLKIFHNHVISLTSHQFQNEAVSCFIVFESIVFAQSRLSVSEQCLMNENFRQDSYVLLSYLVTFVSYNNIIDRILPALLRFIYFNKTPVSKVFVGNFFRECISAAMEEYYIFGKTKQRQLENLIGVFYGSRFNSMDFTAKQERQAQQVKEVVNFLSSLLADLKISEEELTKFVRAVYCLDRIEQPRFRYFPYLGQRTVPIEPDIIFPGMNAVAAMLSQDEDRLTESGIDDTALIRMILFLEKTKANFSSDCGEGGGGGGPCCADDVHDPTELHR